MIRAAKVRAVATFEFVTTITRKGYLISTFGMPVFLLLYAGFIGGIGYFAEQKGNEVKIYGVIDKAEVLHLEGDVEQSPADLPDGVRAALDAVGDRPSMNQAVAFIGPRVFRPYDEDGARAALLEGEIKGYFLLHEDYLVTGIVEAFLSEDVDFSADGAQRALGRLLLERLFEGHVDATVVERVRKPIADDSPDWTVTHEGTTEERHPLAVLAKLIIPMVFAVLLVVSLMMSASYLVQGTATEKENKVAEVLLSSADPDEILTGKLLGLAGAGLIQVAVWFGMIVVATAVFAATLATFGIELPWGALAAALPFFVAGYLFLGSLILGIGSLGGNLKESQQLTIAPSLLAVTPMMFLGILLTDPHALPGLIMTWIPFTAPVTVILRLTLDASGIAWWEVVGSFLVLAASTGLAIKLGARLFRVGMLLSGARSKLREIIRQARLSS